MSDSTATQCNIPEGERSSPADVTSPEDGVVQIAFPVSGMSCGGCASRLEKALKQQTGVSDASVNFALEKAEIAYDDNATGASELAAAIRDTGFEVALQTVVLDVTGMTCAGCASRVDKALRVVPGVVDARVNAATDRADIEWTGDGDVSALIDAVEGAGYQATVRPGAAARRKAEEEKRAAERRAAEKAEIQTFAIAAALTLPLVLQMVGHAFGVNFRLPGWAEMALATPVQFWIGWRFYKGAWQSLKGGAGNMDVLVAMGTSAAYFFSVYNLFGAGPGAGGHLYFEAAAVIITLVLFGKILEARAKRGTSAAISELMALRPDMARVERDGRQVDVPLEDVEIGDTVIVKPGERLPVDGEVIDGISQADESLITGESLPVDKVAGDKVTGGALNGSGLLKIRTGRVGEAATLSRIIQMVENAQSGKAPVQRLVDRISAIFVPVIVAIAASTFFGWLLAGGGFESALIAAVSVLVIACPCALGLATPTAIVAGTGAAARAGILFRDVDALELAHRVDTVVFDKTGTLTEGRPAVTGFYPQGDAANRVLSLAASLQTASEHPLAKAVVAHAAGQGAEIAEVKDFASHTGFGVSGKVEGKEVLIGNRALQKDRNIDVSPEFSKPAQSWEDEGMTVVFIAVAGKLSGLAAISDPVRKQTPDAITTLDREGIDSVMMSGDAEKAAKHVAGIAGISDYRSGVLPADKAGAIAGLREKGRVVAMIGDGINDAPALALADVGIAMGSGTDVAVESASIALMRSNPLLVPAALEVSRRTWRKLWQNLFWAFIYNVIGIPLAAFGLLNPAIAGAAMALSSVSVVTSSLMLRGWKPSFVSK